MSSEQWKCEKCGQQGRFLIMGQGFILCPGCGAWFYVQSDNSLVYAPGDTPNFAHILAAAREDGAGR